VCFGKPYVTCDFCFPSLSGKDQRHYKFGNFRFSNTRFSSPLDIRTESTLGFYYNRSRKVASILLALSQILGTIVRVYIYYLPTGTNQTDNRVAHLTPEFARLNVNRALSRLGRAIPGPKGMHSHGAFMPPVIVRTMPRFQANLGKHFAYLLYLGYNQNLYMDSKIHGKQGVDA
jgi:hypothetical protein